MNVFKAAESNRVFKRWFYATWLVAIAIFAALHALHLRADFPNHSPWMFDWAKYTDEGWYGNAAIRAHLSGNWYVKGDFNPAVALPVLPFLEWVVFFITGVTPEAARGVAVAFFFADLLLSYWLIRASGPRWAGMLAVTLMVTSPFLYSFSRLAILEAALMAFTLCALNLVVRLPRMRRPVIASIGIGLLFTLMMLTKTTAVFLFPAVGWALLMVWRREFRLALRCAAAALGAFVITYGLWMAAVVCKGRFGDYRYLFFVNDYPKPREIYWPLVSAIWSFHGGLWADHILIPLAGLLVLGAVVAWWRSGGRDLLLDPVLGASIGATGGYILFMTLQNHPQPRYFVVVAFFCFILIARSAEAMVSVATAEPFHLVPEAHIAGWAVIGLAALAAGINCVRTVHYAAHPEYTFVNAAEQLTHYIDAHPNGNRLLLSISGDEISLMSHVPALCDDFVAPSEAIPDLPAKVAVYKPGWYAVWNDLDPGSLQDLHVHYSLEQVASFKAFDDPERNVLVLFKLHPLPDGEVRDPGMETLNEVLPDDRIDVPVE
jgi:4-amino-4-deoxy-L-arabinose transferase-like glycosyltransferase